MLSYKPKRWGF